LFKKAPRDVQGFASPIPAVRLLRHLNRSLEFSGSHLQAAQDLPVRYNFASRLLLDALLGPIRVQCNVIGLNLLNRSTHRCRHFPRPRQIPPTLMPFRPLFIRPPNRCILRPFPFCSRRIQFRENRFGDIHFIWLFLGPCIPFDIYASGLGGGRRFFYIR
jgi:hypothetical protein